MLEHARHLPGCRGHPGNCHDGMLIDLQNFVCTIVNDGVASSRASIACDQHASGKLERQNRGPLGWLPVLMLHSVLRLRSREWRAQQTLSPENRRKIIRCTRKFLVESQR